MKNSYAKYLIKKTEDDYNRIATAFSNKRSYITPDLLEFKKYVASGDKVLDLGCGNGRLLDVLSDIEIDYLGVDLSANLLEIAQEKHKSNRFLKMDGEKIPARDESFDVIFCLAVLHHLPSSRERVQLLKEVRRVLKPGGKLILTVWNLRLKKEVRRTIFFNNIKRLLHLLAFDDGDILYPFRDGNSEVLAHRYLHCFTEKELVEEQKLAGLNVVESGFQSRGKKVRNENIYTVAN